jgi:hypothetical protein
MQGKYPLLPHMATHGVPTNRRSRSIGSLHLHVKQTCIRCGRTLPEQGVQDRYLLHSLVMSFSAIKVIVALSCLAASTSAAPSSSKTKPDPFSPSSWPLPRKITGDNDTANPGSKTQGWGGIHLHDPSVVLGPDGHYYSFSTHGLTVISRASEKGSLDGYWKIMGSVLDAGSSVIDNTGSTDPWYASPPFSVHTQIADTGIAQGT